MAEAKPKGMVKPEYDTGRFSKTSRALWMDERFMALSKPRPNGQSLWQYLITTKHLTAIPGLIAVREETIAADLGWPIKDLREKFAELRDVGLRVEADWSAGLVWLPNALRHNPPTSPNVVKSWRPALTDTLPRCRLLAVALASIRADLERIMANPAPWLEAFDFASRSLAESLARSLPESLSVSLGERLPQSLAGSTTHDARRTRSTALALARPAPPHSGAGGDSDPPVIDTPSSDPGLAANHPPDPVKAISERGDPPAVEHPPKRRRKADGELQDWAIPGAPPGTTLRSAQKPSAAQFFAAWADLQRQRVSTEHDPGLPADRLNTAFKRIVAVHGEELLRKAWEVWLEDQAYAAKRHPPFCLQAFLTDAKVAELVSIARAATWEEDPDCPGRFELVALPGSE